MKLKFVLIAVVSAVTLAGCDSSSQCLEISSNACHDANGNKVGRWKEKPCDSCDFTETGQYVKGKRHGHWEEGENSGPYVNGKKHGQWKETSWDGDNRSKGIGIGLYVSGVKTGKWEVQYSDGMIATGTYYREERHGFWEMRFPDGYTESGLYMGDNRVGPWEIRSVDDEIICIIYSPPETFSVLYDSKVVGGNPGPCK